MKRESKIGKLFHLWESILMNKAYVSGIWVLIFRIFPLILLIMLFSQAVFSQNWEGMRKTGFWERWAITVNGGYTSYYGDLSRYDTELAGKIVHESGPACGAVVSKYLNNIFGVSGQLLIGSLEGSKNNLSFKTELLEYNLQLRINFVNLFNNKRNHRIGVLGFAGLGQFLFTTTLYNTVEGQITSKTNSSRVPEFVIFAGGGVHYILWKNYSISAGLSLRQCQNDKLDGIKKNGNNDYYTYLSVGLTYYIPTFIKGPLRNKARIACSNFKFASGHR